MKKQNPNVIENIKLNKSENEVLAHLRGEKQPPKKIGKIGRGYIRHERAKLSLKDKGLIYKDKNNILKLTAV